MNCIIWTHAKGAEPSLRIRQMASIIIEIEGDAFKIAKNREGECHSGAVKDLDALLAGWIKG